MATQHLAAVMDVKEQVVDFLPKRIKELTFGIPCVNASLEEKATLTKPSALPKISLTRAFLKYATESFSISPAIVRPRFMDLSILAWVSRASMAGVRRVARACSSATAILVSSNWFCQPST